MNLKKTTTIFVFGAIAVVVLFYVDWILDFGQSNEYEVPAAAVEALYENCYAIKDDAMHRQAFGTIDNPDVQRESWERARQMTAGGGLSWNDVLRLNTQIETDSALTEPVQKSGWWPV